MDPSLSWDWPCVDGSLPSVVWVHRTGACKAWPTPNGLLLLSSAYPGRTADKAASIDTGPGHFADQHEHHYVAIAPVGIQPCCLACFSSPSGWSALTPRTPWRTSLQLAPNPQAILLHLWPSLRWARMSPSAHVLGSGSGESTMVSLAQKSQTTVCWLLGSRKPQMSQ